MRIIISKKIKMVDAEHLSGAITSPSPEKLQPKEEKEIPASKVS